MCHVLEPTRVLKLDCQVRALGVGQGRIQEQAKEKHKQAYLEGCTLHRNNVKPLRK